MKRLFILLFSIVMAGEMEVDGDLKVVGNVQVGTIDSLEQEIVDLKLIIAQLQAQIALLEAQMAFLGQDLNNADCFGIVGGDAILDECGVCGGGGIAEGACDCDGNVLDFCGLCGGDGINEDDCNFTLHFDGDDYVKVASLSQAIVDSNTTLMGWIKVDNIPVSDHGGLFGFRNYSYYDGNFYAMLNKDDGTFIECTYYNTSASITETLSSNTWYHIAMVYNGSAFSSYLNGELYSSSNGSTFISVGSVDFLIGLNIVNDYHFLNGFIDDISLWSTALTQTQIQAYIDIPPTGNEPGLVGYWNFNEGVGGDILHDLSGNENHGTIIGNPTWVQVSP